jgi:hypothetical protein
MSAGQRWRAVHRGGLAGRCLEPLLRSVQRPGGGDVLSFGPAQLVLRLLPLSSGAFVALSHVLYFAVPLALWLVLRTIEPHRVFSRLYLASVLALVFFPSELIVGSGLWLISLALACDERRNGRLVVVATILLGGAMVFTHPALALMSLLYLVVGIGRRAFGRPVPNRSPFAMAALGALLGLGYFVTSRLLVPTNPTVAAGIARSSAAYVDPREMILAIGQFTATGVLWLLLLGPGLIGRFSRIGVVILAIAGVWFAAAGTDLLTFFLPASPHRTSWRWRRCWPSRRRPNG